MKKVERKCTKCKEKISIKESENYIKYTPNGKCNQYFHVDCFKIVNSNRRKINRLTDEQIEELIKRTKEECKNEVQRDELYNYLMDMYETTYLPTYIYNKVSEVLNGQYKGLKRPVPIEDLYDMWKQKRNYLLKVYEENKKKGNEMNLSGRICYDLAILLSRYDSYLNWKEQQTIARVECEERNKSSASMVDYNGIKKQKPLGQTENNTNVDIFSMLDEI